MKKIIAMTVCLVMLAFVFASCTDRSNDNPSDASTTPNTTTQEPDATTTPTNTTTEAPVETTTEAPAETTTEAPAETTTEAPVETTTEAPVETTTEPNVDQLPEIAPTNLNGSALEATLTVTSTDFTNGNEINILVSIKNQSKLEQNDVYVSLALPAGTELATGEAAYYTIEKIAGGETYEKTVKLIARNAAVGQTAVPFTEQADSFYAHYNASCAFRIDGVAKVVTVNLTLVETSITSLVGRVGFTSLNDKGSSFSIDDIVIKSNSDGSVIYSNDFEGTDPKAGMLFADCWGNLTPEQYAAYDYNACWKVETEAGTTNKVLILEPGEGLYGMGVLLGSLNMTDYTYSFRLLDDGAGQLMRPLFGVYGGEAETSTSGKIHSAETCNMYQWVLGGWGNTKTIVQQYVQTEGTTNAAKRVNVGSAVPAILSNFDWIQIDIVVSVDNVELYANGLLLVTVSPEK